MPSLGGTPIPHNQEDSIVYDFDAAFDIDIVIVTCHLLVVPLFYITSTPVIWWSPVSPSKIPWSKSKSNIRERDRQIKRFCVKYGADQQN